MVQYVNRMLNKQACFGVLQKVVDATKKGDAGQHRQRQQLEVFQSRVPGGALQVIRSQSASSWSNQGPSRVTSTSSTTVSIN
jgi:hypothetical protein